MGTKQETEVLEPGEIPVVPEEPAIVIPTEPEPTAVYTAAQVADARREEKDKLYGEIVGLKEELKVIRAEREKAAKVQEDAVRKSEEARTKQEADAKKRAEEEMGFKDLLNQKESEWSARLAKMEEERAMDRELLAREKRYGELLSYRSRRLEEETNNIMPELRDLVALGNSEEEIESSLTSIKERTARILEQVTTAQNQARMAMRTTSVTAPPVGALEQQGETNRSFSAADIKSMDLATYQKYRSRLLGAVSEQVKRSSPYG